MKLYNNYSDFTRETFIDRMLENPQERGLVAKVARDLNTNYRNTLGWWKYYKGTEEVAYKKSEQNKLPDNDPQLYSDDIINNLTERFEGFTISKSQPNNHLQNTIHITVKKRMFESEARDSVENLQTRFEWFMEWILQKIVLSLMKLGLVFYYIRATGF
ncbi:hypothetical protein CU098_004434 [Rhizopus stolonifer]|uniref:Uncharacterized protein n=1 Tax=Rhizopus stolonifer TaxID=4846 RepID=A0A367JAX5_RHIST|nr:hypothetical protein CU098_004434 [Rhizopus stolonifer]